MPAAASNSYPASSPPAFSSISTPILSLPNTPHMEETPKTFCLRTPLAAGPVADVERQIQTQSGRDAREGLGFGMSGNGSASGSEKGSIDMAPSLDKGKAVERLADIDVDIQPEDPEELVGKNDEPSYVDLDMLRKFQRRVQQMEGAGEQGDGRLQRDELLGLTQTLLPLTIDQIPFLQDRLAAQKATISVMQQKAKLSEQLVTIERERHEVEKRAWQSELRALVASRDAELSANSGKRKILDLDVGYHKELEAANKRLDMDNRLMAPRLLDTQRQIERLVNELRLLRPHVILNTQSLASKPLESVEAPPVPLPQYMPQLDRPFSRNMKATMGDARAEHILLAARKVRSMKREGKHVGKLTLTELKKGGVIGPDGGLSYKEGYGNLPLSDYEDEPSGDELVDRQPGPSKPKAQAPVVTPSIAKTKRSGKKGAPTPNSTLPHTPSKSRPTHRASTSVSLPQTTPGGSNFTDLLRAAEMATRPSSPTPGESAVPVLSSVSATRSTRPRPGEDSDEDRASPKKRRGDMWSSASVPDKDSASALDLLAQASQLDAKSAERVVQSSPVLPLSSSRLSVAAMSQSSPTGPSGLGAPIDLTPRVPLSHPLPGRSEDVEASVQTPKGRDRGSSTASDTTYAASQLYPTPGGPESDDLPRSGPFDLTTTNGSKGEVAASSSASSIFASPTGRVVPGLGRYWHYTSEMPMKRMRSPYLKWTSEEDELLARAVAIHGEKWDLVSKGVPTRSYHQVRQRWLRKTGAFDKKAMKEKEKLEPGTRSKSSSAEKEEEGL